MPEHTSQPYRSPSGRSRPDRSRSDRSRSKRVVRRGLAAGCAAMLASAVLAGCGTAQGALQPQPGPSSPASPAPTTPGAPAGPTGPVSPATPATPTPTPTPTQPKSSQPSQSPQSPRPATPKPSTPAPQPPPSTTPPPPAPPASGVATSVVSSTAHGGRTVALTFDDGPGTATGQILDLLAQYGAKATFCQIGPQAAADPAVVRRILAAGHRLCDHSVHHPQPFAALSHDRQVSEISTARDMIVRAGGPGTKVAWFRAPGGGFTASNQQVAASYGMRPLGWSVDTRDWAKPGVPAILAAVQRELRPGGVILMHDGGGDRSQTVAALRQLLPWLASQGYAFDFPAV